MTQLPWEDLEWIGGVVSFAEYAVAVAFEGAFEGVTLSTLDGDDFMRRYGRAVDIFVSYMSGCARPWVPEWSDYFNKAISDMTTITRRKASFYAELLGSYRKLQPGWELKDGRIVRKEG